MDVVVEVKMSVNCGSHEPPVPHYFISSELPLFVSALIKAKHSFSGPSYFQSLACPAGRQLYVRWHFSVQALSVSSLVFANPRKIHPVVVAMGSTSRMII